MNIIHSKYVIAFILFGMFFMLLPGFVLYLSDYEKPGRILMLAYCIPLGLWAVAAFIVLGIEFIREWKDWD